MDRQFRYVKVEFCGKVKSSCSLNDPSLEKWLNSDLTDELMDGLSKAKTNIVYWHLKSNLKIYEIAY